MDDHFSGVALAAPLGAEMKMHTYESPGILALKVGDNSAINLVM
jgi:hypothetical protein